MAVDTGLEITYFGHSCFLLKWPAGPAVMTDPFDASVGYPPPDKPAEIVTCSHEHHDHNAVNRVNGHPEDLHGLTSGGKEWATVRETVQGLGIYTVPTYHDADGGQKRGKNAAFVFESGNLRVAHLGDLGHALTPGQVAALGRLDILLIPVGGFFTIDARTAWDVVARLNPAVVIPMHYKTEVNADWPIADLQPFVAGWPDVVWLGKREHQVEVPQNMTQPAKPQVLIFAYN
ncbi:MAG: MBL fold metallo-hydrolase [Firmicutes bacterium]|nr:MBL fold metallo-hydrolase [Bacillota bacterium]